MEKKIYYPHLDLLKGLAILLMVMGHVIPWTLESDILQKPFMLLDEKSLGLALVYQVIYSFHMPLLFFVSGFLFFRPILHNKHYLMDVMKKRVKRILLPYIMTGTLLYLSRGHWGYWFLQCLFFMDVLVALVFYIVDYFKLEIKYEVCLMVLVGFFLYLLERVSVNWEQNTDGIIVVGRLLHFYPAFIMGVMIRQYEKLRAWISNEILLFLCLITYVLLFVISGYHIPKVGFIVNLFLPLSMILYLNHLFKNIGGGLCHKLLSWIGKNSMEVYILHVFFVMVFKKVGIFMMSLDSPITIVTFQIVYSFMLSLIAITLSVITSWFLKENKIIKLLLFGL